MKEQEKTVLWPAYFDSSKKRREGRKVPKNIAVPNPSLTELQRAAEHLGLEPEVEAEVSHPSTPWRKTGRIWVKKKEVKARILVKVAKEIAVMRQQVKK